jgi:hypothetical protein
MFVSHVEQRRFMHKTSNRKVRITTLHAAEHRVCRLLLRSPNSDFKSYTKKLLDFRLHRIQQKKGNCKCRNVRIYTSHKHACYACHRSMYAHTCLGFRV